MPFPRALVKISQIHPKTKTRKRFPEFSPPMGSFPFWKPRAMRTFAMLNPEIGLHAEVSDRWLMQRTTPWSISATDEDKTIVVLVNWFALPTAANLSPKEHWPLTAVTESWTSLVFKISGCEIENDRDETGLVHWIMQRSNCIFKKKKIFFFAQESPPRSRTQCWRREQIDLARHSPYPLVLITYGQLMIITSANFSFKCTGAINKNRMGRRRSSGYLGRALPELQALPSARMRIK